jgi:molybdenum cofactor cytidylyltransferase
VKIGAVILAAGNSSRLGRAKQLLQYRGESLVRRTARAALDAGCRPVAIVVGPVRETVAAALHDLEVELVPNESWRRGIGTSIRSGVGALKECDALVILVCDQPHVSAQLIRQLSAVHEETRKPIVASAYASTLGVPVLFARDYFDRLLALGDEHGAKFLLVAEPNDVARVAFPRGAVDIDTASDLEKLLSRQAAG